MVFTIIAFVASIVGLPLTYILGRRSLQHPQMRVATDFSTLLSPTDMLTKTGLSLSFREERIDRISRTLIALWVHRGNTVRGSDVVDEDPLRIELPDNDRVLDAQLIAWSRPQNKVSLRVQDETVRLNFDFLDEGDGVIVEVLHQGTARATHKGTVRGATISAPSDAALDPESLIWMREDSPWRRLKRRTKTTRRKRLLLLFPALATVGFLAFVTWVDLRRGDPRVVETGSYNLSSLAGQHKFASKVRAVGIGESFRIIYFMILIQFILVVIQAIVTFFGGRATIPMTLLNNVIDDGRWDTTIQPDSNEVAAP